MPTFVYIGGTQPTGDVQIVVNPQDLKRHVRDDRQEEPMPAEIEAFNHKWKLDKPQQLDPQKFDSAAKFDHAVMKLRINKYFEEVEEEVPGPVFEAPKRRVRKARAEAGE